jgi:hypothetical protein
MKLYCVCHKEFKSNVVERLTQSERKHVISYIVKYPKRKAQFSNIVSNVKEYELENYNPQYQKDSFYEYSVAAHLYLNPRLAEGITHVGVLHSDIIMQKGCVDEMIETFAITPETIFCDTLFRPPPRNTTAIEPPLWMTTEQAQFIADYVSERLYPVDMEKVYSRGWIGGMAVADKDVFIRFGEFLNKYSSDFRRVLNETVLASHMWANIPNSYCFITERMWGFYLMSLNRPIKHMNIIHDREYKQYTI